MVELNYKKGFKRIAVVVGVLVTVVGLISILVGFNVLLSGDDSAGMISILSPIAVFLCAGIALCLIYKIIPRNPYVVIFYVCLVPAIIGFLEFILIPIIPDPDARKGWIEDPQIWIVTATFFYVFLTVIYMIIKFCVKGFRTSE